MRQNRSNLTPAENTAGSVSQDENGRLTNQTREVDAALTSLDADELARIDRALERMAEDSYEPVRGMRPADRLRASEGGAHDPALRGLQVALGAEARRARLNRAPGQAAVIDGQNRL
jgi:hypothetical protein